MDSLAARFDDSFLQRAVAGVKLPRHAWADLFLERATLRRVEWDAHLGLRHSAGQREGFALRQVESGEQRLATQEGLSAAGILDLCGSRELGPPQSGDASSSRGEDEPEADLRWAEALVHSLAAMLASSSRGVTALAIKVEIRHREIGVVRPGGPVRRALGDRVVLTCQVKGSPGALSAGVGAATPQALVATNPASRLLGQIEERLADSREAREAPAGEWPVIFAAGAGGVFFHEACGHALEGDLVLRAASPFRNLLGSRVAPEFVGAMDDSTQPGLEGSYAWDDEGTSARGTILIAKGILKSFLADRFTGERLGGGSTGNGRRESYRDLPLPRMSNAFLLAGEEEPEAILRDAGRGIFVRRLEGGRMDPATGDFSFTASSGSLLEGGRITAPLHPFRLVGNGLAALRGIRRIGRDLSFGEGDGTCGKEGQKVPVASGLPTLLLDSLAVQPL
jgi:TldD protein